MHYVNTPHRPAPHRSIGQRLERAKSRHALHDTAFNWLKDWQAANDNLAIKQSLGIDISLQCLDTNIKRTKALEAIFNRLFAELMAMPTISQEGEN
jgi:hypothetical protein